MRRAQMRWEHQVKLDLGSRSEEWMNTEWEHLGSQRKTEEGMFGTHYSGKWLKEEEDLVPNAAI
jgi:hypothetical protein